MTEKREAAAWVASLDRIHELVASAVRTHPDVEARAALRGALVVLESLNEQMIDADVRLAFAEIDRDRRRD